MSEAMARANGRRSKIRAFVEHVFAQQKSRMGLFVRTIGIARARVVVADLVAERGNAEQRFRRVFDDHLDVVSFTQPMFH